ncbi:hypothetical protein JHK87_046662 [Glycine soja]|nr:hypothetical protein JHK87_046662 [Glycine soja]
MSCGNADIKPQTNQFIRENQKDSLMGSLGTRFFGSGFGPCATLVRNYGDSEIERVVIQAAKERKYKTISIIDDKARSPDIIEELKSLGGDIVVPEMKAVANGGTFFAYGKKLPQHVVFEEADHKPVEWTAFLKEKNLKLKALGM